MSLSSSTQGQAELDTSSMSKCVLAPLLCKSGATYMFWIKQQNTKAGSIFTTMEGGGGKGTEGLRVTTKGDRMLLVLFGQQTNKNTFGSNVRGLNKYVNKWVHVAIVWHIDPKFEVYFNGRAQTVLGAKDYDTVGSKIHESPLRMILGRMYLTYRNKLHDPPTKDMVLDEFKTFDRPLTQTEIEMEMKDTQGTQTLWKITVRTAIYPEIFHCTKLFLFCFQNVRYDYFQPKFKPPPCLQIQLPHHQPHRNQTKQKNHRPLSPV